MSGEKLTVDEEIWGLTYLEYFVVYIDLFYLQYDNLLRVDLVGMVSLYGRYL